MSEKEPKHTLKVGDILVEVWGCYVDFCQVTRLAGKTMVEIRQVKKERSDTTDFTGTCTPRTGVFLSDEVLRRRVLGGNTVRIGSFSVARLWAGEPMNWTDWRPRH